MASAVYALCALTSVACALLLARGYLRSRTRLLLWAALCFTGLAMENVLLFMDLIVFPGLDLGLWRESIGLAAVSLLLVGMIWEGT